MQKSKFVRLLSSLSQKELRLFQKFLHSPFFNYSEAVQQLFNYLRKYHPDFHAARLDRQVVFQKIFPAQPYNERKLRNLLHECTTLAETFLVNLHLRQTPQLHKQLLVQAYGRRDLYPYFVKHTEELIAEINQQPQRDIGSFRDLLLLHEQYYFHPATDKLRAGGDALQAMLQALDLSFMSNKLRLANEVAARGKVVQQELPMRFVPEVMARIDDEALSHPLLSTYALLYQLNEQGEEAIFQALKEQLLTQNHQLRFDDQQVMLLQLLNFAIRRGNTGAAVFLKEAFALYQWGLRQELLQENGKITDTTFTNIAVLGCKINALEQVADFIEESADLLEPHIREAAVTLSLAYLYYHQQAYEKVDTLIGNYTFESVLYQFRARPILIRALFELFRQDNTYYDLLFSRMEAFEKYLRRNRTLSEEQRAPYLSFIKFLRKLSRLIVQGRLRAKEQEKLSQRIRDHQTVSNKTWLLDQCCS